MANDPPLNNLNSLLAILGGLPPVQTTSAPQLPLVDRRVYKNNALSLDGYTFSNCVFINCHLSTRTGDFRLKDCHLQDCKIFFYGSAQRVVKLSSILIGNWDQLPEGLRVFVEPDLGITVE